MQAVRCVLLISALATSSSLLVRRSTSHISDVLKKIPKNSIHAPSLIRETCRQCSSRSKDSPMGTDVNYPITSAEQPSWMRVCVTDEDIEALGAELGQLAGTGDVLLLRGDLGAGKTTLARGLIRNKFGDPDMRVTSPSYLLDNTYEYEEGKLIHHMDLYRLPTGCDMSILGIPDIFTSALCIIEWPQRMQGKLPAEFLDVDLRIGDAEKRLIKLQPSCRRWREKLEKLYGQPTS